MDQVAIGSIESSLNSIFTTETWTPLQQQTYAILNNFIKNYKEEYRKSEMKNDRIIIRNNLKDQMWFIHSRAKPLISHLLDSMTLIHYIYDETELMINFLLVIGFNSFNVHACLYQNKVNNYLNYYIYFKSKRATQKAYLAYYNQSMGLIPSESMTKLKLPEFDKIYEVTGLNSEIFCQYDLMVFFSEIVMFYEESGTLGAFPISHGVPSSLNQLTEKYNIYVQQKNTDHGYKLI